MLLSSLTSAGSCNASWIQLALDFAGHKDAFVLWHQVCLTQLTLHEAVRPSSHVQASYVWS